MTENRFNRALLEAVDDGLLFLGESARHLVYHSVEKVFQISPEQIPEKPEAFHRALETLLGSGGKVIEKQIVKKLYSGLGLSFEDCEGWTLANCISYAKKRNKTIYRDLLSSTHGVATLGQHPRRGSE
jgi:hypothetical protein